MHRFKKGLKTPVPNITLETGVYYSIYSHSAGQEITLLPRTLQQLPDLRNKQIKRNIVLSAVDHNIGEGSCGLYVHVVHGFYGGEVLGDDSLQVAATLFYVADDAAEDTLIGVGFHVDFDV